MDTSYYQMDMMDFSEALQQISLVLRGGVLTIPLSYVGRWEGAR